MTTSRTSHGRELRRSTELLERARRVIPGASQTMSKGPTQWAQGMAPNFVRRADGATVWDVDGNAWLDFPMALGPVILGHRHPAVDEAIARQLQDGITFTLPHELEVEVAERIVATVPCAEMVRFAKSGSDATSAAVRLARAITGRDHVIVAGYHGWHDWYVGSTSRHLGVPDAERALVHTVTPFDAAALAAALDARNGQIAAVVLEPIGAGDPDPAYLQAAVDLAREAGALAIFDEVISGFRVAMGGAQERYGVTPDLAAFGKALGNGMPISALAGSVAHMSVLEDVFFSGTHGGEALSLAAARATLDTLRDHPVHEHIHRLGLALQAGIRDAIARQGLADWVSCGGEPSWTLVGIREPDPASPGLPAKTLLQQELLRRGVLYNGSHFTCLAHTDADIARAVQAYHEALEVVAQALPDGIGARLEVPVLSPVFRPTA